jgi:hypothetical protein
VVDLGEETPPKLKIRDRYDAQIEARADPALCRSRALSDRTQVEASW